MADWGLDGNERSKRPWTLPADVLVPDKVITDPVHGDIHLTLLERAFVDSPPYQRLRRVRQLGETHWVYPGAVHTRFSHGLGAMRLAQLLLDQIGEQSQGLHATEDLFEAGEGPPSKQWAEATVLARLGALLHDLTHVPAGHTLEDDLRLLTPHDKNDDRFEALWTEMVASVCDQIALECSEDDADAIRRILLGSEGDLYKELKSLVVAKGGDALSPHEMRYPFCADLVGNTICADLLDYLARDHLFTGLPHSLGTRFTSAFFVVPKDRGPYSKRLALNIMRNEHERTDVVSELLKALRYRYELTERVLVHHAKLAADAMLGEAIERWGWATWYSEAKRKGVIDEGQFQGRFDAHKIVERRRELEPPEVSGSPIREATKDAMDRELRQIGDDELLAVLKNLPARGDLPTEVSPLLREASDLATQLQSRKLFKCVARVGPRDAPAEALWKMYGHADSRAGLEQGAQRFARLGNAPQVIVWLPPPDMRLKLAEVLVKHSRGISPFVSYERAGRRRGSEIYDAHEALWAAYVFVHPTVQRDRAAVNRVVAFLAREMGVRWEGYDHLGGTPDQWPIRQSIAEVQAIERESEIDKAFNAHRHDFDRVAARQPVTYVALRTQVSNILND